MSDRINYATFLWGLVITIVGVALLGVGLGWWDFRLDLRYVGPTALIVIGLIVLIGSLTRRRGRS